MDIDIDDLKALAESAASKELQSQDAGCEDMSILSSLMISYSVRLQRAYFSSCNV